VEVAIPLVFRDLALRYAEVVPNAGLAETLNSLRATGSSGGGARELVVFARLNGIRTANS
jgi:hypothetical protein